jgi:hypothetical protein
MVAIGINCVLSMNLADPMNLSFGSGFYLKDSKISNLGADLIYHVKF